MSMDSGIVFQGNLIHNILLRDVITSNVLGELWFLIGGHHYRFSAEEFCLISGLTMKITRDIDIQL